MAKNHIMLDLETLSDKPDALVLSIGAVKFDENGVRDEYYQVIDWSDQNLKPFDISFGTVQWWFRQSPEARAEFAKKGGVEPLVALQEFAEFVGKNAKVWGNGSEFDNIILTHMCRAYGMNPPWLFWNNRCYRTIKNLYKDVKLVRSGQHHNALDDARTQAEHLVAICNKYDVKLG